MPYDTTLTPSSQSANGGDFLRLSVHLPNGTALQPEAVPGYSLMELMRAYGVPIRADCGGACVCATCHVSVPAHWAGLLPPPGAEEVARLDDIPGADETSRLACQIAMREDLDGLEVALHADSVANLTHWIGG